MFRDVVGPRKRAGGLQRIARPRQGCARIHLSVGCYYRLEKHGAKRDGQPWTGHAQNRIRRNQCLSPAAMRAVCLASVRKAKSKLRKQKTAPSKNAAPGK